MSGQQPPPYPGSYGEEPSGQQPQNPQHPPRNPQQPPPQAPQQQRPQPPPYPGPPPSQQPPPYPGQYGQQPPYGQEQPYPGQPYPQQPYPGQPYPGQPYPQQPYPGYPPPPGYASSAAKEPIDSTARTIGWIIAATGLLVAIAAFLTWGTIEGFGQSYAINGVTGSDFPGDDKTRDGVLTLTLAIPAIAFAIVRALGKLSLTAAIIGTVAGVLVVLIAIIDIADISNNADDLPGSGVNIDTTVGVGLWLTLVGGIALAVASLIGIVKRR
jgi:hypothetical protein